MPFWGGTVLECNFRNWEFHSKIAQRRRKSANPPRQYFWFIPDDLRQLSPCSPRFVLSVAFMCVSRFYFGAELLLKSKTTKKTNFQNLNQKNNTSIQKSQRRRKPINPSRVYDVNQSMHREEALKKWTIIVSYGGATEDMKLAICVHHISVYLQYRSLLRYCQYFFPIWEDFLSYPYLSNANRLCIKILSEFLANL